MKSALRRASTAPDTAEASHGDSMAAKRSSTTASDAPRRPSLATISRRLGRSKKPQSTTTPPSNDLNRLGQLFFALPNELHALVLSFLGPQDIFTLRLACRTTNTILSLCAPTLLSVHVPQTLPTDYLPHILALHPPPIPNVSLAHHLTLLRRHAVLTQMSSLLTSYMQMKIYMLPPSRQHQRITALNSSHTALLASHFYSALWTVDHYLSTYRHLLLHEHPQHTSRERSRFWRCVPCGTALEAVVADYTPESLVPAYQVMRLLGIHLKASSRAPSYAGTIERVVRRWSRRPAGEEELALVVLLGGTDVLRRVTVLKGTYNSRLEVVRGFLETVEEAVEENKLLQLEREQREKPRVARMVVGKRGIERVELVVEAERQAAAELRRQHEATASAASSSKGKEPEVLGDSGLEPSVSARAASQTTGGDDSEPAYAAANPIAALSLPHRLVTEHTLDQIPLLEDILLPQLRRRIEAERLLDYLPPEDRDEDLETPYHWVRRVICGEEEEGAVLERARGDGTDDADADADADAATGTAEGDPLQGPAAPPQQQQQGNAYVPPLPPGHNPAGGRRQSMFGAMSRHMLVSVGRDD